MDKQANWIWLAEAAANDQYGEFYDGFTYHGGTAQLCISADSNYAVYINGEFVDSGQYPDYPWYKVSDTLDVTRFCRPGENHLAVIVWYYGISNMGYYPGTAAVRYALTADGACLCGSGTETLSRRSRAYESGLEKIITTQLGFSFHYDATAEDGWMLGDLQGFCPSRLTEQAQQLHPRPIDKCVVGAPAQALALVREQTHVLCDLGRETAGYLYLRVRSSVRQRLLIAYGEHIVDGGVRRRIHDRDFSVEVTVGPGETVYCNPFRRLGGRYLELRSQAPVEVLQLTVRPVEYPLNFVGKLPADPLREKIYAVSARTLSLCMHDHYEDTPWREQALYAMDSRNQILCGYYAFGEYRFPRASLRLMARDDRPDGHLAICFPTDLPLTIPSFTLHYFTEVYEYGVYSGDLSLAREIWPKLQSVLQAFIDRMGPDGLIPNWEDKAYWNFYEWSEGLQGHLHYDTGVCVDTALQCLFAMTLRTMDKIAAQVGRQTAYGALADKVCDAVNARLFDENRGLYVNSDHDSTCSELVNAWAVLSGAAVGARAERIAAVLAAGDAGLTPTTLSMVCFKYDALLLVDRNRYREQILTELDTKYKKMLDWGATSFWETELGEKDFHNAGSLCHGWSAMPIYYYTTLQEL